MAKKAKRKATKKITETVAERVNRETRQQLAKTRRDQQQIYKLVGQVSRVIKRSDAALDRFATMLVQRFAALARMEGTGDPK